MRLVMMPRGTTGKQALMKSRDPAHLKELQSKGGQTLTSSQLKSFGLAAGVPKMAGVKGQLARYVAGGAGKGALVGAAGGAGAGAVMGPDGQKGKAALRGALAGAAVGGAGTGVYKAVKAGTTLGGAMIGNRIAKKDPIGGLYAGLEAGRVVGTTLGVGAGVSAGIAAGKGVAKAMKPTKKRREKQVKTAAILDELSKMAGEYQDLMRARDSAHLEMGNSATNPAHARFQQTSKRMHEIEQARKPSLEIAKSRHARRLAGTAKKVAGPGILRRAVSIFSKVK